MFVSTCTWNLKGLLLLLFTHLSFSENQTLSSVYTVPIEFPKNESQYPFVHNTTILKALASQTSNDTEVDDLLHGGLFSNISSIPTSANSKIFKNGSDTNHIVRKWDSELIENGNNTEDGRVNVSIAIQSHNRHEYSSKLPVVQGQLAAIMTFIFVFIVVVGYIGLLSWRRFLLTRYNNREMLVNEEDFYDPNDLRHFSI